MNANCDKKQNKTKQKAWLYQNPEVHNNSSKPKILVSLYCSDTYTRRIHTTFGILYKHREYDRRPNNPGNFGTVLHPCSLKKIELKCEIKFCEGMRTQKRQAICYFDL